MELLIGLIIVALGVVFIPQKVGDVKGFSIESLPDCEPQDQKGGYSIAYDSAFEYGRDQTLIPFALLKAHAIRESSLKPNAFRQESNGRASYGLMQILWWKNSNRFKKWGYSDDRIGDGSYLYEPNPNCAIAAHLIRENLDRFGNLRDAINAYNTGVAEKTRVAPFNYVDDVLKYYSKIVGRSVV